MAPASVCFRIHEFMMRLAVVFTVGCLAMPASANAQSATAPPAAAEAPAATSFWQPFVQVPGDFSRFVSVDTARILGVASIGSVAAGRLDDEGMALAREQWQPSIGFAIGNVGGGFYAQTGSAFAVYAIGRWGGAERVAAIGSDLLRAQILTQGTVQVTKLASRRLRPDGSDRFSLPSGHTAGAFATATVLHQHFGWKVGVPVFAGSAFVAASRMSANKHHLSDVLMGAAFGVAAARTVTVGSGAHRFSVGVQPTDGGGAITFTKR